MSVKVAVTHYPEGGGHAVRMLAVAQALEARGASVDLAGGGPGSRYLRRNGYESYEPTAVDFVTAYQRGSLGRVLRESLPRAGHRVVDYVRWLRREAPDALVTDDMFAAVAAPLVGVPLFVLTHNIPALYESSLERTAAALHIGYQRRSARAIVYPALWPFSADDPPGLTRIPPVALAPPGAPAPTTDPGVLLVPSEFSTDFDRLAETLRTAGHRVTRIGGEGWEPVPALLPWVEAAEAVVCAGYSTVMEAAVAGTPCVIYPATDEQRGVARLIERADLEGFATVGSIEAVAEAVETVGTPDPRPNGAAEAAAVILRNLDVSK